MYQNNALRDFAIRELEPRALTVGYIPIARELDIPEQEERTLLKLASRLAPITLEEAEVLGMKAFVSLAARREIEVSARSIRIPWVGLGVSQIAMGYTSDSWPSPSPKSLRLNAREEIIKFHIENIIR